MQDLPKRKKLRLKNFDYTKEGYYFLTICTKDKQHILSDIVSDHDNPAIVRLTAIGEISESYLKSIPGIDKYVIMPNHIHLIIHKTNGKSISSDMRSFKALVSKKAGQSIWQTSYYDHIIRNEEDYQEKRQYIDENPLRWIEDEYNI